MEQEREKCAVIEREKRRGRRRAEAATFCMCVCAVTAATGVCVRVFTSRVHCSKNTPAEAASVCLSRNPDPLTGSTHSLGAAGTSFFIRPAPGTALPEWRWSERPAEPWLSRGDRSVSISAGRKEAIFPYKVWMLVSSGLSVRLQLYKNCLKSSKR